MTAIIIGERRARTRKDTHTRTTRRTTTTRRNQRKRTTIETYDSDVGHAGKLLQLEIGAEN